METRTILITVTILLIFTIIQLGTLIYFIIGGYEVDCNYLVCKFTKTEIIKNYYDNCNYNGKSINCSILDEHLLTLNETG